MMREVGEGSIWASVLATLVTVGTVIVLYLPLLLG